jgi:hypothetical protein
VASLFISHSSQDRAKTDELVDRLRAAGFEALFVDFDPSCGIPAGRNWERELHAQLRKADGVVYVATPAAAASRWCFAELSLARSISKPIFPVLVAGTERLALLGDVQWVDVVAEGERAFERLLEGLRRARLDPADAFGWDPTRRPYPGLEPFGIEDAAVFFGRDAEIDRLLQLLQPTLRYAAGRFVGIVGPSGSGKSSLLYAGLLPRLQRLPERWILLPAFPPGQHPIKNLAGSLAEAFAARRQSFSRAELAARLERGPGELVELAGELAETGPGEPKVLVVIDQAEELVTRTGAHEQQRFLGLLDAALTDSSPVWVVATLRSEFLSTAPERAGLAEVIDDAVVVEPLSWGRLAEVIARPAQRAGLEFAPGLVERMVEETTGGDAVPLLAYTLRALYERVGPEATISIADYETAGGVVGALQRRANQVLDELGRRGRGSLVLPTLLKLATVEGEAEPSRRRLRRGALSPDEQTVVQAFVDARLLTSHSEDHEATVEVAHEALLRQWTPLRHAIEDSRASLRLRSELEREAADWDQGSRDESYLLRGGRLAAFEEWANSHDDELTRPEREFLQASRALASWELEAARRSKRRLRRLVAVVAALLVLAIVGGGLAALQNEKAALQNERAQAQARLAQIQSSLALSRQLGIQASDLLETRPDTAILVGLQGLSVAPGHSQNLPASLVTEIDRLGRSPTGAVRGAILSPDRRTLATFGYGHALQLWDVASGKLLREFRDPNSSRAVAFSVAFSPDGRFLTNASESEVVTWEVATGKPHGALRGHLDVVTDIAISPDGRVLASVSADRTIRLWDILTGRLLGMPLTGHTDPVTSVAFSPDGIMLASVSGSGTVWLWDVATGQPRKQRQLHAVASYEISFSPDGRQLRADGDRRTWAWDTVTGEQRGTEGADAAFSLFGRQPNARFTAWIACKIVNRNLSEVEWKRFIPSLPYQRTCPELPAGKGAPIDAPVASYG